MGDFLRVRAQVNIKKPLHHCVLLGNGHGKQPLPCPLRYERLPRFCFFCGVQPRPGPRRCTGVGYFDYDHGTPTSPGQSTNVGTGIDKQASSGSTVVNDMESPPISASHTSEQPTTVDATVEKAMVADEAAEFFPTPTVANKEVVGLGTAAPASPTLQQAGAVANP
ncbi:hypothetical protein V6N12_058199 [Hibiscus sabdariffa]|uniref:Uncharacterized protein n=1 Tax=Hibiscus sabdariffa TaxID=183260 RepID=A0ABR2EVI3_9ROSI